MKTNPAPQPPPLDSSEPLPQPDLSGLNDTTALTDEAPPDAVPSKGINRIENKTILTPTGGFLGKSYTHTLNPYVGCGFAGALCGTFCYAQHQHWIVRGRPWGFYGAKHDIREAYRRDYNRVKSPRGGDPHRLNIYMASSTDPYSPQEKKLGLTRSILEEMQIRPPDVLVIQTHGTLINRDLDLIQSLSKLCELWVSITCETDMDPVPGFPPHASRPAKRLETLRRFRENGVPTQATISPLMPLANPEAFAHALDAACDRVVIDHYLLGDGTHGARTKRTNFLHLLEQTGFGEWTRLEKMWEVRDLLAQVLGHERVLVSAEGFNAVGDARKPAIHIAQGGRTIPENPPEATQPAGAQPEALPIPIPTPAAGISPLSRLNEPEGAPRDLYKVLRDHQQGASEKLRLLHTFLPLIIKQFFGDLPLPALSWDEAHWQTLGSYREKDGLELSHRINLNSSHADRPLAEILRTLTHELGHLDQQIHGKPPKPGSVRDHNYHNAEFRRKMREIGIPCNKHGVSLGIEAPFLGFLKELGIETDTFPFKREGQTPNDRPDGSDGKASRPGSRLKPWACKCPRARVWASFKVELSATCHKCGSPFQRQ
jgi:DNA repair photolyase